MATDTVLFPGVAATAHPMRGLASVAGSPTLQRSKPAAEVTRSQFLKTMKTPAATPSPGTPPVIRAAAYVRMSTEHQQYSTSNQMDVIREYAARRNMEIVIT